MESSSAAEAVAMSMSSASRTRMVLLTARGAPVGDQRPADRRLQLGP